MTGAERLDGLCRGRPPDRAGDIQGEEITRLEKAVCRGGGDVVGVHEIRSLPATRSHRRVGRRADADRLGADHQVLAVRLVPDGCHVDTHACRFLERRELCFGLMREAVTDAERVPPQTMRIGAHRPAPFS